MRITRQTLGGRQPQPFAQSACVPSDLGNAGGSAGVEGNEGGIMVGEVVQACRQSQLSTEQGVLGLVAHVFVCCGAMSRLRTPAIHGFVCASIAHLTPPHPCAHRCSVEFSPFFAHRLAVAASQNFGIQGFGELLVLAVAPDGNLAIETTSVQSSSRHC